MSQNEQLPKTRQEARDNNEPLYFTGRECVNGHIDSRYTASAECRQCRRDTTERNKTHPEKIEKNKQYQKENNQRERRKAWMAEYMRDYRKGKRRLIANDS